MIGAGCGKLTVHASRYAWVAGKSGRVTYVVYNYPMYA